MNAKDFKPSLFKILSAEEVPSLLERLPRRKTSMFKNTLLPKKPHCHFPAVLVEQSVE